jgi:PPOX class probable F420-dependent enzyme
MLAYHRAMPEPRLAALADRPAGDPTPHPTLSPALRAYLEEPRYASIATISADGQPHVAIVWYLLTDDGLILNSRRERHWPQNLQRDPRISIAVQDWVRPNHWVGLIGHAELLHEGDAAIDDIMAMARRYEGDPESYRGQDRLSFLFHIDRTFEYGRPRK